MSDGDNPQQTVDPRREIAALRVLAEAGMSEDAPDANARAREKLLQLHRARFAANRHLDLENTAPMAWDRRRDLAAPYALTAADLEALDWICRVAGTRHVGAGRLLDRVLSEDLLPEESTEKRLFELARIRPPVARFIARWLCRDKRPDLQVLSYWLDFGGPEAAIIAAGIREIQSGSGGDELRIVRHFVEHAGRIPQIWSETDLQARRAELLVEIAEERWRRESKDDKADARRLLERAVELGSRCAAGLLWRERYNAAADRAAFLREWLAGSPNRDAQGENVCMFIATELERGNIGGAPDLEAAFAWYASALGLATIHSDETGGLEHTACLAIARALDNRHTGTHSTRRAELARYVTNRSGLALGWYERGLELGSAACLGGWLMASEILCPDLDGALDQVSRWLAAGGDLRTRDPQLLFARDRIRERGESDVQIPKASKSADPARGAKWLHVGSLLGDAESQYLLAGLYARGHGVERDPQRARECLHKAGAGGSGRAVAALAKIERSVRAPAKLESDPETTPLESAAANALTGAEETDELLDLVEVYLKMGDIKFARDMLENLLLRGNEAQQERANKLFAAIAKK
ncbi:MAG: hypothetical protein A3H35_16815 [Betaproteobacteria bacterium RIFCSPLOWO2_02_FULL_62_17]|nr:MAG: hypothetical protein A3H35_16815 [Betaproteobacteria bacterium RIFCSPLOWO2_02_FULL_62_17]